MTMTMTMTTRRMTRPIYVASALLVVAVFALVVSSTTATASSTASSSTDRMVVGSSIFRQQRSSSRTSQQQQQQEGLSSGSGLSSSKGSSSKRQGRWLKDESLPSLHRRNQQLLLQSSRNLQSHSSTRRNLQTSNNNNAMSVCELAKIDEELNIFGTNEISCECTTIELDDRYSEFININDQPTSVELKCIDTRCSYCSKDGQTCDRYSYGSIYEEIPRTATAAAYIAQVGYFETNQYIEGRDEAVIYTEYYDPLNLDIGNNDDIPVHSCSMDIDGLRCAVCEYIDCIDDTTASGEGTNNLYYGLKVICSNIKIGDGLGGYQTASDFETCNKEQINDIGSNQGVFEMYDDSYGQCYTADTACDRDTLELDNENNNSYYTCQCKDREDELPNNVNSPFLLDVKLRCEKKTNIGLDGVFDCSTIKDDSIMRTYSSYAIETETRTIQINDSDGSDGKTIRIEQFDCETTSGSSSKGCNSCIASINDNVCTSCTMIECNANDDGNNDLVPRILCGNVDSSMEGNVIDMCYSSSDTLINTPFEYFGQGSQCGGFLSQLPLPATAEPVAGTPDRNIDNDVNNTPPSQPQEVPSPVLTAAPVSRMACDEKLRELGSRQNYVDGALMVCECYDIGEIDAFTPETDTGSLLSCTTNNGGCGDVNGGSVCNAVYGGSSEDDQDGAVCFREELVQGFLPDGNKTPLTRTTTYTHGTALENSLIGHTLTLTEYENDSGSCQLLIDGIVCNSCQLEACDGNLGIRPIVDCTNVIAEDTFKLDSCDTFPTYEDGLLVRLASGASGADNAYTDFNVCSNEFTTSTTPDQQDNGSGIVDPSLPTTCQLAQPIVLASQQDVTSAIGRSNSDIDSDNAAFVSLISSTVGLPTVDGSSSSIQSCITGEEEEDSSPSLWYKLNGDGQGVHASVCREPTNFEARISVYSSSSRAGSCVGNNLNCVAGTYSSAAGAAAIVIESICDVHWIANEDTTYYIRIHGSSADQTGEFNLFIQTVLDDHIDTCSRTTDETDSTTSLNQACLKCAKEKSNIDISSDGDMDCQCIEKTSNTGGYHLTCVDVSCLKCNPTQDVCGFNTYELDIQSDSKVEAPSYESFYFLNNNNNREDAIAIVAGIQQDTNNKCIDINDPYQTCMSSRDEIMMSSRDDDNNNEKVFCECRGTSQEGDFMLLCSLYDSYEYCTGNECANILFGQTISQYGYVTTEFRNFDFVNTTDSIVVERTDNGCSVSMNEKQCNKCELTQCDNNNNVDTLLGVIGGDIGGDVGMFTDMSFDCSNVMEGDDAATATAISTTFECGRVGDGGDGGSLLSILVGDLKEKINAVGEEEQQKQTIPPDAFPPTMPPVTQPTSAVDDETIDYDNDNNSTSIPSTPISNNTGDIPSKTNEAIDAWKEANTASSAPPVTTVLGTAFVFLLMGTLSAFLVS